MDSTYLIAGIDTGIGKTVATGLLAKTLMARGRDVITVKMVQTGNDGFSEDIDAHRRICGGLRFDEDGLGLTAPQIFTFPSSPKLAAEREGRTVDLARIASSVKTCAAHHDTVLVEAAGGLHVPLTDDTLTIDFAAQQGWPVILVTCGRLGSLNHTLLSLEALRARRMRVAGVVYNWCAGTDPDIDRDTPAMIRTYLARWGFPPVVIRVPEVPADGPWPTLDLDELFTS